MLRSVGRGTGPDTEAPVRVAVSTISRAARSMASWSYAFSLIRILLVARVANFFRFCGRKRGAVQKGGQRPKVVSIGYLRTEGRRSRRPPCSVLLDDLGDDPRAYGATALADREPEALVHRDRLDQLDRHLDVVAGHHHLRA